MWEKELQAAIDAGLAAKDVILNIYHQKFEVEIKEDNSPVTIADKSADKMIKDYLSKMFPTHAFLTEESEDNKNRLNNDFVWIVDPVDGTKDFVAHDDEFTTNIALCYKHRIVVGVVVIPAKNELYYASEGNGSFYLKIGEKPCRIHVNDKIDDLTCLISVFHFNDREKDAIERHKDRIKHVERRGSSIKACLIAHGQAEIHYRFSPNTKEWDTAAIQAIISEAGGVFLDLKLKEIKYNREDVYNRDGYIIVNRKENLLL